MLKGIGASDGIGIGRVMIIAEQTLEYTPREIADVDAELDPMKFVGRAPEQVEEFITEVVDPIRKRYPNVAVAESELRV